MNDDGIEWLDAEARRLIAACRSVSTDGTPIYSPDASGNFVGTWIRDFAYMVEGCPGAIPVSDLAEVVETMIRGQLPDGTIPNKHMANGRFAYLVKGCGNRPPTDNPQYLVRLVFEHWKLAGDLSLFSRHSQALERALGSLPLDSAGCLIWIDPSSPHPGYGFTDAIAKSGCELFSSVLLWEAHLLMQHLYRAEGAGANADLHGGAAARTRSALSGLWDEGSGAFVAASERCRQIDVWGSAYAVKRGVTPPEQAASISRFLVDRYDSYVSEGLARHVVEAAGWDALLVPMEIGSSQNGGYWGLPCGWIARAISVTDPELAHRLLTSMLNSYMTHGVYEWVSCRERHNPGYVASAALPLADILELRA